MRIYLPRFHVRDLAANLDRFAQDCAEAAGLGAELAVFPEQFLTGYHGAGEAGELIAVFERVSSENRQLTICCGTITQDGRNVQLWYRAGVKLAAYEKVHLFRPNGEHELWQPGSSYAALTHNGMRIGLGTCNDLRFPEQMHALSRAGRLDMLVYPALWPWQRDHVWSALLRARAIEHSAFCVGCCVAGVDNGSEHFDGAGNHVFDPQGNEVYPAGRIYTLDSARLEDRVVDTRSDYITVDDVAEYAG